MRVKAFLDGPDALMQKKRAAAYRECRRAVDAVLKSIGDCGPDIEATLPLWTKVIKLFNALP
jgi:hypothetical protein